MTLKALIVDDERLARQELRRLLGEGHPDVEIVGEASSVGQARECLGATHPELLFLDIQMRGETGFDLLLALSAERPAERMPKVIFTTAHEVYALRAFEFQAFDYLLKPIVPARLAATLARLARAGAAACDPGPMPADHVPDPTPLGEDDQVFLREGDRCHLVRVRDLRLLEAEDDGSRVFLTDNARLLVPRSLQELEARLDARWFFRANRRQIVNLRWVERVEPWFSGGLLAVLPDGVKVELSRRQAQRFKERLSL